MSDDLVKHLRDHTEKVSVGGGSWWETPDVCEEAADRIEELEAEIEWWKQDSAAAWDKCEDYRVKLEKATAALNFVVAAKGLTDPTEYDWWHERRKTLAELKGSNNA